MATGTRRAVRNDLPSPTERGRSRRLIRLGCTRLHHREGQGDKEASQGTTRLSEWPWSRIGMEMGIEEKCDGRRTLVQKRKDEELRTFVHCTTRHITTQLAEPTTASKNITHDDKKTHLPDELTTATCGYARPRRSRSQMSAGRVGFQASGPWNWCCDMLPFPSCV